MIHVTESITIEAEAFEPSDLAEQMTSIADIIRQSEAAGFTVAKSSLKTDVASLSWKLAVLMRRPSATPDEWTLTLEAMTREAPF